MNIYSYRNQRSGDSLSTANPEELIIDKVLSHKVLNQNSIETGYYSNQNYYLIKFVGKSYRDVKWLSEMALDDLQLPSNIKHQNEAKINKYLESVIFSDKSALTEFDLIPNLNETNVGDFFNPNYTIPEKIIFIHDILSSKLSDDSSSYYFSTKSFQEENEKTYKIISRLIPNYNEQNRFLIKWTDLDYSDLTWENEDTLLPYPQLTTEYLTRVRSPNDLYLKDINIISNFEQSPNIIRISSPKINLCRYQIDTFNFLYEAWSNQKTSIIADDISYNEIDSILAFLSYFSYRKERPSFLLVLPTEVIEQWQKAIDNKTSLTSLNLKENKDSIEIMTKCEFEIPNTRISQYNCILTTHQILIDHLRDFIRIRWDIAIINERIPPYTLDLKFFSLLPKLSISFLSLVTIQLQKLDKASYFSILHLCEPLNYDEFKPTDDDQVDFQQLDEENRPLVISRAEENIYDIEEIFLKCPMTAAQQRYIKDIFQKNADFFNDKSHQNNFAVLSNIILDILKVCDHPFLLSNVKSMIYNEEKKSYSSDETFEFSNLMKTKLLVMSSGKYIILDKLLKKFYAIFSQSPNLLINRVCIFCQQIEVMDLIEEFIQYQGYEYQRIDSSIRGNARQQRIDMFNSSTSHDFIFLTTTKSTELTLNNVNNFFLFDSSLNPINDIDFVTHISAIKQDRIIYRFLMDCSLETCIQIYHNHSFQEMNLLLNSKDNFYLMERNLRYSALHAFEDAIADDLSSINIDAFLQNSKSLHYDDKLNLINENNQSHFVDSNNHNHFEFESTNSFDFDYPTFGFNEFTDKSATPQRCSSSDQKDLLNLLGIRFNDCEKLNKSDFWSILKNNDHVQTEIKPEITKSRIKEVEHHSTKLTEWNIEILKSLENSMLTFGYGRWLQLSKKEGKPIKEIIIASNAILNDLLMSTKNSSPILETVYQFYKSVSNSIIHEDERLFIRNYGPLIRQMHQSISPIEYIEQLEEIYIINSSVGYDLFLRNSDEYPLIPLYKRILSTNHLDSDVFPSDSEDLLRYVPLVPQTKPAPWWKVSDDTVLFMHVYANGLPIQNGLRFSGSIVPPQSALTKRIKAVVNVLKGIFITFSKKKKFLAFSDTEFDANNPESISVLLLTYENLKESLKTLNEDEEFRILAIASKTGIVDKKKLFTNANLNPIKYRAFQHFLKLIETCAEGEFTRSNRNSDFLRGYLSDPNMTKERLKTNLRNILLLKYISTIDDFSSFSKNDTELLHFINRNGLCQFESDKNIVSRFHNPSGVTKYLYRLLQVEDYYMHHKTEEQSNSTEDTDDFFDSNKEQGSTGSGKTRQPLYINNSGKGGKRPAKSATRIALSLSTNDDKTSDENTNYQNSDEIEKDTPINPSDNNLIKNKWSPASENETSNPEEKIGNKIASSEEDGFILPVSSKNSGKYLGIKSESTKTSEVNRHTSAKGSSKTSMKNLRLPSQSSSESENNVDKSHEEDLNEHENLINEEDILNEINLIDEEDAANRNRNLNDKVFSDEEETISRDFFTGISPPLKEEPKEQESYHQSEPLNHLTPLPMPKISQQDHFSSKEPFTRKSDGHEHFTKQQPVQFPEIDQKEPPKHHETIINTKIDEHDHSNEQEPLKINQQEPIKLPEPIQIITQHESASENEQKEPINEKEEEESHNEIDEKFKPTSELYQKRMKVINNYLPMQLNSTVTLISMGHVVINKPLFHSKRYIYCDGFQSEKLYASIKNPNERTLYVSTITDDGSESPIFTVYLKEDPSISYSGNAPTKPWIALLYDIDKVRNNGTSPTRNISVSGPEFFGLASSKAIKLMKMMPGAELLSEFAPKPVIPLDEEIEIDNEELASSLPITTSETTTPSQKTEVETVSIDKIEEDDLKSGKYQNDDDQNVSLFHHSFGMIASSSNDESQSESEEDSTTTIVKLKSLKLKATNPNVNKFNEQTRVNSPVTRYLFLKFADLLNDQEIAKSFREEQNATFTFNRSFH